MRQCCTVSRAEPVGPRPTRVCFAIQRATSMGLLTLAAQRVRAWCTSWIWPATRRCCTASRTAPMEATPAAGGWRGPPPHPTGPPTLVGREAAAGNLYGPTYSGGTESTGVIFKLILQERGGTGRRPVLLDQRVDGAGGGLARDLKGNFVVLAGFESLGGQRRSLLHGDPGFGASQPHGPFPVFAGEFERAIAGVHFHRTRAGEGAALRQHIQTVGGGIFPDELQPSAAILG